jgi:hypothetical protein
VREAGTGQLDAPRPTCVCALIGRRSVAQPPVHRGQLRITSRGARLRPYQFRTSRTPTHAYVRTWVCISTWATFLRAIAAPTRCLCWGRFSLPSRRLITQWWGLPWWPKGSEDPAATASTSR